MDRVESPSAVFVMPSAALWFRPPRCAMSAFSERRSQTFANSLWRISRSFAAGCGRLGVAKVGAVAAAALRPV